MEADLEFEFEGSEGPQRAETADLVDSAPEVSLKAGGELGMLEDRECADVDASAKCCKSAGVEVDL
jgi:hypothetical protein